MRTRITCHFTGILLAALASACGGGAGGAQDGSFRLLEFLEQGKNGIPRNRVLTFLFSAPVAGGQDFAGRLKIQNTQASNFSLATGTYTVSGDRVTFSPRLPNKQDRSDAGLRENGAYTVFLKAGPDALRSATGDAISRPAELLFDTSEFFEDPFPTEPPRVTGLWARDPTQPAGAARTDISRLDPRPGTHALLDNAELVDALRYIDPGTGPQYGTPWRLELELTEPVDPSTVTTDNIRMSEIYADATTSGDLASPFAPPDHFGTPVDFKVPIAVTLEQQILPDGDYDVRIVVRPLVALVDNTRYRLAFGGNILGIDFRQQFIGANGLTGDGQTLVSGSAPYPEPGGLGYTAEFLVRDRPEVHASRTVTYDPLTDGIKPETGQTTTDEDLHNAALYNPSFAPGTAVGKVSDFGDGRDGNLAVSAGSILVIDTGDTPNAPSGVSVSVTDLDYLDSYTNKGMPLSGQRTVQGLEPFEMQLENLTVSASSTLRIVGVNPCRLLVRGLVQVNGTIDAGGSAGEDGSLSLSDPGAGGPGGFAGGRSPKGDKSCTLYGGNDCSSFDGFLNLCAAAKAWFPFARKGEGPGRGNQGGDSIPYWAQLNSGGIVAAGDNTATGGGGGSHATVGAQGEDRINATGTPGSAGPSCSRYGTPNSSVIGARGVPGPVYGDRTARDWIGGSGGGGGGSVGEHGGAIGAYGTSGGGGGGGGGYLEIVSAGSVFVNGGGTISVAGGAGGAGFLEANVSPQYGTTYQSAWNTVTGGGGGGAGGTISVVSGGDISVLGGFLDARGGAGGARGTYAGISNAGSNAGGDGGKGFIFLMDIDGSVELSTGTVAAGEYDAFTYGVLTVSRFDLDRFGGINAITEMFGMPAADPDYEEISTLDVLAQVNAGQTIRIFASSAKADPDDPLRPDVGTETQLYEIAVVRYESGASTVELKGGMDSLNPLGTPARDAFTRVYASFEYDNEVDAAIGPFASVDAVTVRFSFNG